MGKELAAQLERAWQGGYAVMLSPLLSGEADWHGRVAIYVYSGDIRQSEPWRGNPCSVEQVPGELARVLDFVEAQNV